MNKFYSNLSRSGRFFTLIIILILGSQSTIIAQCSMNCNSGNNISLDVNCTATITPDMMLEGSTSGCIGPFTIEIYDLAGNLISGSPTIDANYVDQTLSVSVIDQGSTNSCSGLITVEDYYKPVINCTDIQISCNASSHPDDIGYPVVIDGCDPSPTLSYTDQINNLSCNSSVQEIIRTWTATDASGNQAIPCQQTISLVRPVLTGIIFPANAFIDCNNPNTDPSNTGVPVLNGQAVTNSGACNLWIYHTDTAPASVCEGSFVFVRTWNISETWCGNSTTVTGTQTIKVEDTTGPQINCPADFTISANTSSCTGTITIPAATATDNCSSNNNIDILITGPNGPIASGQSITVPIGSYDLTYTATDDCGNTSSCTTTVSMDDGIPPVAICISSTTIGLTNTDPTLVPAAVFDDGSYDNCGPITFLARRMDNPACPGNDATDFDTTVPFTCCDVGTVVTVEFSVTDAVNQLTNICMVQVVVQDNIPMELNCPSNITINCDQDYTDLTLTGDATGSDNCGIDDLSFIDAPDLDNCNIGQILRTWTLTDSYGQTTSCTQVITSSSTGPGTITFPADVLNAECGDADDTSLTGEPVTSGNCNQYGSGISDVVFFLEDSCVRKVLRTWYVVDWCSGDIETGTQLIKETDTQAPIITGVPGDMNVPCDAIPPVATPTAVDACSEATLSFEETEVMVGCNQTITRTWTAVDNCGNETSEAQVITVMDNEPPVIMDVPTDANVSCDAVPSVPQVTASDNCSDPTIDLDETTTPGSCPSNYTITRIWTATDDCGNTSTEQQTVTVTDSTPPVLSNIPADTNAECDNIPAAPMVNATDNCDSNPTIAIDSDTSPGACNGQSIITRTWTATDNCGNTSSAQQVITVTDNTAPIFSNVPADIDAECDNIPTPVAPTTTDNCDPNPIITVDQSTIPLSCEDEYALIYVWTATDACGNSTIASQTINVSDSSPPVFNSDPTDMDVSCDNVPSADVLTATDNCDSNPDLDFDETIVPGACDDTYTIERVWTATDNCGNTSSVDQTINVSDTEDPVLAGVPGDITVECDEVPTPPTVTASDNCDPNPSVVFEETGSPSNGCDGNFALVRTWTATDRCGNTSIQSQSITIIDITAPEIDGVPDNLILECNQAIPNPASPTVFDDCDNEVELIFDEENTPGDCENNFTIVRTWTATDFCGNATTQTQTITVDDTTDPFLMGVPNDITVDCDEIPVAAMPTATDNCDNDVEIVFVETNNPLGCTAEFAIMRTWTATDNCGNAVTGTQIITTFDIEPPTLSDFPLDLTNECHEIPAIPDITATDNCDTDVPVVFTETLIQEPTDCEDEYTLIRNWVATDDCGNSVEHTQTIDIEDMTSPFLPPISPFLFVDCTDIPPVIDPIPIDSCDNDVDLEFTEVNNEGTCVNGAYTIVRTWIATDNCGNQLVQVQTINVTDNNDPTLVGVPADVTVECDNLPDPDAVTATDPCDMNVMVELMETTTPSSCPDSYILTRTWTATDNCGNTDIATQVITVEDTTDPVLSGAPTNLDIECDAVPTPANVTALDNCADDVPVVFTEEITPGDCPNSFTITRSWTATDDCGNSVDAVQTITVSDTEAPTLIGVPVNLTVECDEVPLAPNLVAIDNCDLDVPVFFTQTEDLTCPNEYIITRTWEVSDDCGNTASAVQIITVEDTTPPEITCTVDTTFRFLNNVFICELLDFIPVSATDNCTSNNDLTISWTMDFNADGTIDSTGMFNNGFSVALIYPIGTHVATFTTEDECGNTATCSSVVVVTDNVVPAFFCNQLTVALNFQTGMAHTAAVDYVVEPFFECCVDTVLFELPDGSFTDSIWWDCDDTDFLPLGVDTKVWVFDCYGNGAFCGTKTIVLPPAEDPDFCDPVPPPFFSMISGSIYTEELNLIENVTVDLSGGVSASAFTTDYGYYEFPGIPVNNNYMVSPEMDINPLNGVSTYDIVLITKHILAMQELNSPYKLIAADIDRSGHITTFDIVSLKKLILGIDSVFANNTSWRFVDANFVFPNPQDPFLTTFPENCSVNDLYNSVNNVNFVGVKVGDVNQSATTNLAGLGDDRQGNLIIKAKNEATKKGDLIELDFRAQDFKNVLGYQFTINFDPSALTFVGMEAGDLDAVSESNFGTSLLDKGWLTTNWYDAKGVSLDDDAILFTIQFEAATTSKLSDLIRISSDYTSAEAYTGEQKREVQLYFDQIDSSQDIDESITLYQNRPNPFKEQTIISFQLAKGEQVTLEVFDAAGRSCIKESKTLESGYQEWLVNASELRSTGVYYYELRTATQTVRNKMIAAW